MVKENERDKSAKLSAGRLYNRNSQKIQPPLDLNRSAKLQVHPTG